MLGKSTIKAINFTRPIKAIETIVAGYLLKYRKDFPGISRENLCRIFVKVQESY